MTDTEATIRVAKRDYLGSRQTRADWVRYLARVDVAREQARIRAARIATLAVYRDRPTR